jgi:putative heavy-metal chelation protein
MLAKVEGQIAKWIGDYPFAVCNQSALGEAVAECIPDNAQRYFILTSVAASVASALSSQSLRQGGDEVFEVVKNRPADWVDGVKTALVVGFGGYLETLLAEKNIGKLHVVDLSYDRRRTDIDAKIASYRERFPVKIITVSPRLDGATQLRDFDLISITGSTLSNGTLEGILAEARKDSKLILQGQSASLHPKFLFQAGIDWVATTIKTAAVSRMARGDYSGRSLRPILEGGLPWIYLVPRRGQ